MPRTRPLIGVALILTGAAVGAHLMRSTLGDGTRVQAALLDAATRGTRARDTEERRVAEEQVSIAAQLEPLNAALRARVNGATLLDLFENEDWWHPFRAQFPVVRIVSGDQLVATRGPDVGATADDLIRLARQQKVSSAMIPVGDRIFVMSATRLSPSPERNPPPTVDPDPELIPAANPELNSAPNPDPTPVPESVLLFGRPIAVPTPVAVSAPTRSRFGDRHFLWLAVVIGLSGLALVFTRPKGSSPGSMPQPIHHEPTSKMGSVIRPRSQVIDIVDPGINPGFGRYRLIDRVGEGGMAELFIAEAAGVEGFTRNFVLKRLRPELLSDKNAVAQFIDEARMQASLVHSNIVPVFDFGVVRGEYFMTQEYIVGRDLSKLVHKHGEVGGTGLPETLAYYIASETLQALSYAHEKQDQNGWPMDIVHRDISAANVMVSLHGEVKLSDFGIVKSNRRISQTKVGVVKGNVSFMSPEQARGQVVDHRSDLFSLAHVLHFCLTGRLLYFGKNDLDVLYRAAKGVSAEDLATIRRMPHPAGEILEKALAFEPSERFQSAAEFADALPAHIGTGKRETAQLMQQLFGDEIRRGSRSAVAATLAT